MKPQTNQCAHCTVPIPETPAQHLDVLVNKIDLIRHDGNEVLRALPTNAPLFGVVDVVVALGHLRLAAVALDKATDLIEAAEVAR